MENKDQYHEASSLKYECLLFDVDDTLYPANSALTEECKKNIEEYMVQKLGIEENKVFDMCHFLYKNYGTIMAGLKATGYNFDCDDYLRFVDGTLPYETLKPDPVLRSLLLSVPIQKVIFSNANETHVAKVLSRLGLEDCFKEIICFDTLNPFNRSNVADDGDGSRPIVCKPFEDAFDKAFKIANINPKKTLFFDDSARNIQTAKNMGLHTVLVGESHRSPSGADYALESIHNIRVALPDLWEFDENTESARN